MKIYKIDCEGETHRIGLDDEGYLIPLDHPEGGEYYIALEEMGAESEVPECIELLWEIEEADSQEKLDRMFLSAAGDKDLRLMDLLLDIGADVNAGDGYALRSAATYGRTDVVSFLLDAGISIEGQSLAIAAYWGQTDVVKLLLDTGIDANMRHGEAFLEAVREGNLDIVELLLDAGADVNIRDDSALRSAA